jgi:signal transduction histidine kinase
MEMFASLAASVITQSRLIDENLESERLAAIGETVAGLSHYTKNILTVVSVSSEIIDDGLVQKKIEILENPWKIMKRSLKRLSYVIEDMLAYSTERQPVYELYPLAELIDDVVTSVEGMQGRKSIQIELDVSGLSEPVMIDSRGMHRCLLNLVLNAVDELPDADGCVKVAGTRLDSGIVRITVEDNGAGIKEENLDRIFNPFFSTKGNRGTGLGLAVTQKIVAEHGGRISAGNRETGGAVFTIEFPERPRESDGVMG